ncbi:DUF2059 domain-containing protein [Frigidibacter sp.]|uniref:DUF2059 domain-containing protein n=1 Tax=Frigidibacter sp. TaxID=2586418 RepID=UPI0027353950|nr:DUF2059 domain-containing protein [Frigidibacter sp.]MDP3340131.1 DUF2059 domain-containing protein [Frigidibacter sp.]
MHHALHPLRRAATPVLLVASLALAGLAPAFAQEPPAPAQNGAPAQSAEAAQLTEILQLPVLLEIMQDEGVAYGEDLQADMFPGQGGAEWTRTVEQIYAPDRLMPVFTEVFAAELEGTETAAMWAFFEEGTGARAVELEIAARRALLDPGVEEAADQQLEEMLATESPRLLAIEEFAEAGDLIEANVLGGLNANLAFYRGMIDGGGLPQETSEAQLLADVWSQEDAIRTETRDWLYAYLALAYDPMSDDELQAYTDFSAGAAGKALNRALFAGFDAVFAQVSYELGLGAARYLAGQDI